MGKVAEESGMVGDGPAFRLTSSRGDCALVEFVDMRLDRESEVFSVRASIVPSSAWGWSQRRNWERARQQNPTSSSALIRWAVKPPAAYARDFGPLDPSWTYGGPVDPDASGVALASILGEETIPTMKRLLDREELLAEFLDPSFDFHRDRPIGWARTLLRVDDASPEELEELLGQVETDYPVADEFAAWARMRASRS
ncbi:hypothetical protein ACIQF6_04645 [Kitasatospora sp. NPDC092948]|uniref:hypothetical protein n=1 Tax=Kitasatospora sp. NPDC092948 TaxID=3364088 RepID=UPI0037F7B36E